MRLCKGVLLPFPKRHRRVVQSTDDDSTSPRNDLDALKAAKKIRKPPEEASHKKKKHERSECTKRTIAVNRFSSRVSVRTENNRGILRLVSILTLDWRRLTSRVRSVPSTPISIERSVARQQSIKVTRKHGNNTRARGSAGSAGKLLKVLKGWVFVAHSYRNSSEPDSLSSSVFLLFRQ